MSDKDQPKNEPQKETQQPQPQRERFDGGAIPDKTRTWEHIDTNSGSTIKKGNSTPYTTKDGNN